jgi:hypothetical protein
MAKSRIGIPDMNYIRREVLISEVAQALGLKIKGRRSAHCWRVEHHKNGDRTPSISFFKNRAKCQVCDSGSLSNIDLVMAHENYSCGQAMAWIAGRWQVPMIPKHSKLRRPERWTTGRVGVSDCSVVEDLVRSGIWAWLDDAGRAVLIALLCFADPTTGAATISLRGLCRYSGKASRTTISGVISRLEIIGLLDVRRARDGAVRKVSTYRVTPDTNKFQELSAGVHARLVAERDREKMLLVPSPFKAVPNLAGLPRSNPVSSVVDRLENPRFPVVNRSIQSSPDQSERPLGVDASKQNHHLMRVAINRDQAEETATETQ